MSELSDEVISWNLQEFLEMCDPEKRLIPYYQLLSKENQRTNLVSRETLSPKQSNIVNTNSFAGLENLAAESLAPVHTLKKKKFERYLDIGSGGGFPALPLMLTCNMQSSTLVERTQKKAAALRRMLVGLNLRAEIIEDTFENLHLPPAQFDLVTIRLVKLDEDMLSRVMELIATQGVCIYYAKPSFQVNNPELNYHTIHYSFDGGKVHCATFFYRNTP